MFKVAILGCENSHANSFLDAVINRKLYTDIEFVGVYSEDREAAEKLQEKFGVAVAESFDEFVGKVDGIMVTARHGDNHYKYAKPYIESGIPMFIDKPITCSEEDAKAFLEELKASNVPVCGGSMCVYAEHIQKLKKAVADQEYGKPLGGFLRAPVDMVNPYGDFFFYSQHLVQVTMEIFGNYPKAVQAVSSGEVHSCIIRYADYDVNLSFVEHNYLYYAGISCEKDVMGSTYMLDGCSDQELIEFHELLEGKTQKHSYEDFFAPVYVLNALDRALKSGCEEAVHKYEA